VRACAYVYTHTNIELVKKNEDEKNTKKKESKKNNKEEEEEEEEEERYTLYPGGKFSYHIILAKQTRA
jgi:hypothetical protein